MPRNLQVPMIKPSLLQAPQSVALPLRVFQEHALVGRDSVEPHSERTDRWFKLGWHDLFHRVNHLVVLMERRTDSKENVQAVSNLIAVIAIQFIRPMIDGELRAEPDVYAIAMRKIVHITK